MRRSILVDNGIKHDKVDHSMDCLIISSGPRRAAVKSSGKHMGRTCHDLDSTY